MTTAVGSARAHRILFTPSISRRTTTGSPDPVLLFCEEIPR